MLTVDNVSFSYGKQKVLSGISFSVAPGECAVIAGSNGSGKSTLLSLAAGILRPDSGTVSVDGRIGYVPQDTALFEDMTTADNLRFFAQLSGSPQYGDLAFSMADCMNKRVSTLSVGMKKRLSIVCALLGEPELLLLDEPCASLDVSFRCELIRLMETLLSQGRSIVYVAHDTNEFSTFYSSLIFLSGGACRTFSRDELSGKCDETGYDVKLFLSFKTLIESQNKQESE